MKYLLIAGILACTGLTFAQRKIEQTVPVRSGQTIQMSFDDPELIKVHTWEKNEVLIRGEVSINRGENDDAFEVVVENTSGAVSISSRLRDRDKIPGRTLIRKGDQEYYFPTNDHKDPAIMKFLEENGGSYTYMSNGIIRDINLEVWVPQGVATSIKAKYGLVEITNFNAPLQVDAKYGGVDATVVASKTGDLIARTKYGEILTNLDVKFAPVDEQKNWTEIKTTFGNGPAYVLESHYGKVYLRKP